MSHRFLTALVVYGCLSLATHGCAPAGGHGGQTSASGGNGKASGGGSSGNGGSSGSGGSAGSGRSGGSGGSAGSGGSSGSGGSAGSGGSSGSGGSAGSGGATGSGGLSGSGGSAAGGGSPGSGGKGGSSGSGGSAGGSGVSTNCTFTQSSSTSSKIATVGIVTWSTDLANVKSAKIDFGLTTSYGFTAPVDLTQKDYRTLLLGMKQSKTYHYRITATGSSGDCQSSDYTIATGALPNGMPKITVSTKNASALYGGFLITGQFVSMGGGGGSPAYILDADNEFVWAFNLPSDVTGARMDYAGTHMWLNSANVPSSGATVHRVTMDGLTDENLSSKFTGLNHQLTILPDETVAFYAYGSNGCEDIKEYSPSGNVKTIVNSGTAMGGSSGCHVNNIQYSKDDDTLVFSDLDNQVVVKVKRSDGSTVWVLNGSKSTFSGATWKGGEHGIHLLGLDRLLIFNNNSTFSMGGGGSGNGDGSGSIAIELSLDLSAKKITNAWQYKANPGIDTSVMGDLQRLPNGNTVVGYSTSGVLHEVDSKGTVLQTLTWNNLTQFGYIEKRASLYGPPPR